MGDELPTIAELLGVEAAGATIHGDVAKHLHPHRRDQLPATSCLHFTQFRRDKGSQTISSTGSGTDLLEEPRPVSGVFGSIHKKFHHSACCENENLTLVHCAEAFVIGDKVHDII